MITEILSAFSVLLFVIGLLVLAAWAVRRFGLLPNQPRIKNSDKQIEIIESRMIDGRNRLLVVHWKDQDFLLSSNPNGIRLLSSSDTAQQSTFEKMVEDNVARD